MSTPKAALSLIVNSGFVLVVYNRRYKGWGLPGGKVEDGEDIAEAQRRELFEETGLHTAHAQLIYQAPTESSDSGRQVYVFRVEPETYPDLRASYVHEEGSEVEWMTQADLMKFSPFSSFYEKLFKSIGGEAGDSSD